MLSSLENMVEYDFKVVLNYSALKDKMSLRASSTTLRRRIDMIENTFKVWRIGGVVDSTKLRRIADEIKIIKGIIYFPCTQIIKSSFWVFSWSSASWTENVVLWRNCLGISWKDFTVHICSARAQIQSLKSS